MVLGAAISSTFELSCIQYKKIGSDIHVQSLQEALKEDKGTVPKRERTKSHWCYRP